MLTSEVEVAEFRGGRDERGAVRVVADVAGDGAHRRARREFGGGGVEGGRVAGVDDEGPTLGGEGPGQGEAEAPRGAGDDGDRQCARPIGLLSLRRVRRSMRW